MRFSFSGLKKFDQCPARFHFAQSKREPESQEPGKENGREKHDQIATAIRSDLSGLSPKMEQFIFKNFPSAGIRQIENPVEYKGVCFDISGRIDLWALEGDDILRICDWKAFPGDNNDPDQLRLYAALLLTHQWTWAKVWFYFYGTDTYAEYTWRRDDIEMFWENTQARCDEIVGMKEFPGTPGMHCSGCGYTHKCPSAKRYEVVECNTEELAVQLAASVIQAEAYVKKTKALVKMWMLDAGTEEITCGDQRLYILHSAPELRTGKAEKPKKIKVVDVPAAPVVEKPQFDDALDKPIVIIKPVEKIIESNLPAGAQTTMDTVPNAADGVALRPWADDETFIEIERYMAAMDILRYPPRSTDALDKMAEYIGAKYWDATADQKRAAVARLHAEYEKRHGLGQRLPPAEEKKDLPFADAPPAEKPERLSSGKLYDLIVALGRGKARASGADKHMIIMKELGKHWLDASKEEREACRVRLQDEVDAKKGEESENV